jgi:predicted transcriptional regulator
MFLMVAVLVISVIKKRLNRGAGRCGSVHALENQNKLSVLGYVLLHPGCSLSEISLKLDMKIGTVKYHVQMLESEGRIILRRVSKFTLLFTCSQAYSEQAKALLSYMRNETSKSILYAIMEKPGITNWELSEKFLLDKSSIHWHIERFILDRLVESKRDGRYKKYFVEPEVAKLLNNSPKLEINRGCALRLFS